ncbi:hypothetical protein EDB84DRAFT_1566833 [Lactarius hengduanensis]|nr:hypothetical protein EDB84DRAFT_1566833 [Lactarius hengduanensis]
MQSPQHSGPWSEESERFSTPPMPITGDGFSITPGDILERVMGEVYALRPPNSAFDKKAVKRKLRTWFYNHYSRPHRQLIKFTRKWSARNAFYHENKEDITELAKKMSGGVPGSEAFLGALQDATTSLWMTLSSEEQVPYAECAKEWSEDRPPRDVQAKMARATFRGRIVRDFQTQLFKTCGVRSIVLVAYEDKDGNPKAAMDDWNRVLDDGMSFSDFCPHWRNCPVWHEWMKYARTCFGPENGNMERSKTIKSRINILVDANREPQVPSVTPGDGYQTKIIQATLREYCTAHIRFISGKKNATISWSKLSSDPSGWIEEDCFPSGFQWADPSKIRSGHVFELLDHWRQREKAGLTPLIWNRSCDLLADVDEPAQHRNDHSDDEDEYENFANEIRDVSSSQPQHLSPSLLPYPSLSPRPVDRISGSSHDSGESDARPQAGSSGLRSFRRHHATGNVSEPREYGRSKQLPKMSQRAM